MGKAKSIAISMMLLGLILGCGGKKKELQDQKRAEQYDYRAALQSYQIGINYLNNKEIMRGIESLANATQLDPNNFRYQYGLGLAYSMNGQFEQAETALKTAIAINPNDTETYNLLGSVYIELERYDDAITALKRVIQDTSYPQPAFPFFNLGLCMQRQGRATEAIAAFRRATEMKPDFYRAYISLAQIYKDQEDYQNALAFFKKAEPGFANEAEVLFEIGRANFLLKQYDEAKTYLAQVSILFPPPAIDKPTQDMLRAIEIIQRKSRK